MRSVPPVALYHGTARRNLASILRQGLLKGSRHHVHLLADIDTAMKVGRRHGSPVVLEVAAGRLHRHGEIFYRSPNDVWLVEHVPPGDLAVLPDPASNET